MDIGIKGIVKFLHEDGSNARSQCTRDNFFIWLLFVIISRRCGLGFGTFTENGSGGLPGDLRA